MVRRLRRGSRVVRQRPRLIRSERRGIPRETRFAQVDSPLDSVGSECSPADAGRPGSAGTLPGHLRLGCLCLSKKSLKNCTSDGVTAPSQKICVLIVPVRDRELLTIRA
jgi:hypothetical protein